MKTKLNATRQDIEPHDDEDEDDFMERCVDETDDETMCQYIWDTSSAKDVRIKTHVSASSEGMEFVLSDETPDRMDDVIMSDGWDLKHFKKNPIALFGHRSDFPIGSWKNLRVENKQLRGHLELAQRGTSERINEIISLVEQGILKAVSVGFKPLAFKDREGSDWGMVFEKCELVETSLVTVPANPNALAVAKGLKISPETMELVFAGQGKENEIQRRGFNGGQAKSNVNRKRPIMSTLGQRIATLQGQIVAKRDELEAHLEKMDDSNVSNADLETTSKLNQDIGQLEKTHEALVNSEKLLAKSTDDGKTRTNRSLVVHTGGGGGNGALEHEVRQRVAAPTVIVNRKKELDILDYVIRAGAVAYASKAWGRNADEVREQVYGDDEATKVACQIIIRAASAPALTTVTGWAQELVQQVYEGLMPLLMPKAILTRLAAAGLSLGFGAAGKIVIPTRSRTPSLAGSFVGEGMPIPVRQGAFTSQTLTPKKMAVITTWTKEMDIHSIPAIEGILREAIQQDTTVAVDSVLIDANPATTIRPAGLLNSVGATAATAGGGIAAFVTDIVNLISAISTATYGNTRNLRWLVNQTDMLRAAMLTAANTGIFPFAAEIRAGTLNGVPLIDSAVVPAKTMILVDAADFVVVGGDAPRMEMSDQATLHMEDTTPLELVASPSTVAAPQRSLFQTDSLALRMVMPLNWLQRRAGTVAWTQNVTW
jgi:HK97 family phage prohead protease/HK97 family phage major capsid protein